MQDPNHGQPGRYLEGRFGNAAWNTGVDATTMGMFPESQFGKWGAVGAAKGINTIGNEINDLRSQGNTPPNNNIPVYKAEIQKNVVRKNQQ